MKPRRVVVTGLGAITPIGNNLNQFWKNLLVGKSGAAPITYFDTENFKTKFACELKNYNFLDFFDKKEARRLDKFCQYSLISSDEAIEDSGIKKIKLNDEKIGVIWGAGIGGLETFQNEIIGFTENNKFPRFNPFFIPKMISDIAPGMISIKNGFKGPNFATVSACASSTNAMIDALNYIKMDYADVMHALSTRNDDPKTASRPFDRDRDGFVLGEGSGAMILEEYEHAKKRNAKIYAEFIGGGLSADAYHMTAPHPEGIGAKSVMVNALKNAKISPKEVDAINMHGTSTPLGDISESKAIKDVFGEHSYNINLNSTKSMTGHLLGAAGAIEAISIILSINKGLIPPTINNYNLDDKIDSKLNFTISKAQKRIVNIALSNTFGFGGHNACVVFKKI